MGTLADHDRPQFFLLIVLYFLQGIGCGLSYGSIPFLLKTLIPKSSFMQIGIFSMSTYPYSLKILWSPIVDSFYFRKIGRRRSWIIPIQYTIGFIFLILGSTGYLTDIFPQLDPFYEIGSGSAAVDLPKLTVLFTCVIFLCSTQDIAVDGWALEILSEQSLSFASTAQTIGLNMGYFTSFTVFLSFNSTDFINKYFRSVPLPYGWISLPQYLSFCGVLYLVVTTYVWLFTRETMMSPKGMVKLKQEDDLELKTMNIPMKSDHTLKQVYKTFIKIIRLPNVQILCGIHLITKIGFQCNESATQLKLLEKGFKREDLAITVLIDFPFEIIFGYYVGKMSSSSSTTSMTLEKTKSNFLVRLLFGEVGVLTPFLFGFLGRLLAACLGSFVVYMYPEDTNGVLSKWYFLLVIIHNLLGSFMNTIQFVSICAFHTRIADPMIGGTYMTLLNTVSNLGGTWPKLFIFKMIDYFTVREPKCIGCLETITIKDGFYKTNFLCISTGLILYFTVIKKNIKYLQKTNKYSWRSS